MSSATYKTFMLSVVMLSVVMLSVVMLSVVALFMQPIPMLLSTISTADFSATRHVFFKFNLNFESS